MHGRERHLTAARLLSRCGGVFRNVAGGSQINLDAVAYFQKERAWILHSPLGVGHVEVYVRCPVVPGHLDLSRHGNLPIRAVNSEHAMHHYRRLARTRDRPIDPVRSESDLRIASAFQYFLVHLAIPHPAAALTTDGVDHNLTRNLSRRFHLQRTVLEFESAVYGVEDISQRELYVSLRGI